MPPKCMISMGCTTAVQSLLAGKPVIEIQCPDEDNIPPAGFACQLSALSVSSIDSALKIFDQIISREIDSSKYISDCKHLEQLWLNSCSGNASQHIASVISQCFDRISLRPSKAFVLQQLANYFQTLPTKLLTLKNG